MATSAKGNQVQVVIIALLHCAVACDAHANFVWNRRFGIASHHGGEPVF
jgi:hypothetical protein